MSFDQEVTIMKSFSRFLAVTFTALVLSGCAAVPAIAPFAGEIATAVKQAYTMVAGNSDTAETDAVGTGTSSSIIPVAVLPHCEAPLGAVNVVDLEGPYGNTGPMFARFATETGCFTISSPSNGGAKTIEVKALVKTNNPVLTTILKMNVTYSAVIGGKVVKASGGATGNGSDYVELENKAAEQAFEIFVAQMRQRLAAK